MFSSLRKLVHSRAILFAAALSGAVPAFAAGPEEAPFLAENDAAMTRMMQDMAVTPSGDVDRDFVAMMIPHHQGAIDMALAELRHGRNEQLRRIAQEIIVEQQQEIAAMRLAIGAALPPQAAAPTQPATPTDQPPSDPSGAAAHHHHPASTRQEP
jgi:hypothetical protein